MTGGLSPSVGCSTVPRGAAGLMGCPGVSIAGVRCVRERVATSVGGSTAAEESGVLTVAAAVAGTVDVTGSCRGGPDTSIAAIWDGVGVGICWCGSVRWRVLRAGEDRPDASGSAQEVAVGAAVEAGVGVCLGGREASIAAISDGVGVRAWLSVRWRVLRVGVDWSGSSGTVSEVLVGSPRDRLWFVISEYSMVCK